MSTSSSFHLENYEIGIGNITSDRLLRFSLIANNSDPFKTSINQMAFPQYRNFTHWAGHVQTPYSTIKNYQIAWGFGPSPNNASDHRMFELSIPISELELYDDNGDIGIIVGGYGTLGYINGSNFWVFSEVDFHQYVEDSSYYMYYRMEGVSVPSEGAISGYPLIFIAGVVSICIIIVIRKKLK
jgi:hypothetical protein